MKKLILLCTFVLSACAHQDLHVMPGVTPVQVPALPSNLAIKAKKLPPITDNTMGGREVIGANTDQAYNAVAWQLNQIIDLYNCVRDSINNKMKSKVCTK